MGKAKRWILLVGLFFIIPNLSAAGDPPSALDLFPVKVEGRTFENPRFSPDSRWLAFDLCEKKLMDRECRSVIYDIPQDRYFAWRDSKGRPITNVSFSPDGTKAVFVVETNSPFLTFGKYEDRIAVGNIKEGRYSFITPGPGHKRYPEFWKDDSVIYIGTEPDDRSRRKSKYLYIVEPGKPPRKLIETGFYAPSRARPHWDGEQILMAEYGFTEADRDVPFSRRNEILSIRPADGSITVVGVQPSPEYRSDDLFAPAIARIARAVYVEAILEKESNQPRAGFRYDVFVVDDSTSYRGSKLDGRKFRRGVKASDVKAIEWQAARRVSWLVGHLKGMDVTDDGRYLAVIIADTSNRSLRDFRLLIYDPQARTHREIHPIDIQQQTFHQLND